MNARMLTQTLVATLVLGTVAPLSSAQESTSVTVSRDESGARVRRMSMPNFEALRTPDFTREDLPIFTERLILSEAQTERIGHRIDDYLSLFEELVKELASVSGPRTRFAAQRDGADEAEGPRIGIAPPGAAGPGPGAFDDLESQLPPGSQVNVGISIGITEGEDAPPQPLAEVELGIETPDGEDVPAELLEQFQARADELAQQMAQQMASQQEARAAGNAAGPQRPEGPRLIIANPEELEQQQAEMRAKIEVFQKAKGALRTRFVGEAQEDLAPEQIDRWPSLERALTRARSLPKGRLSGESTDLLMVIGAMNLSESSRESLRESMEAYEVDLDGALKRRDAFLVDANQNIDDAIATGEADKAIAIAQKAADLRIAVRRVNAQYMERFAAELDAEGQSVRHAAMRAFYPRVYNPTRGEKLFAAFNKLEGVPTDAAAAVAEVRTTYEQELHAMSEQIRQVIDREEPRAPIRSLEQLKRTMGGEVVAGPGEEPRIMEPEDPIRAALERRAEMDDRYIKLVASLVPAEFAAQLPKPRTHKGPIIIRSGGGD